MGGILAGARVFAAFAALALGAQAASAAGPVLELGRDRFFLDQAEGFQSQPLSSVKVEAGSMLSIAFLSWVKDSLARRARPQSGSFLFTDFNGTVKARRDFSDAVITEVVLPSADTRQNAPAVLSATIAGKFSAQTKGSDEKLTQRHLESAWRSAAFAVEIDGLAADLRKVSRLDPIVIDTAHRTPLKLGLYVSMESSKGFRDWVGAASTTPPKNGAIVWYGPDRKVLLRVQLEGLVAKAIEPAPGGPPMAIRVELAAGGATITTPASERLLAQPERGAR